MDRLKDAAARWQKLEVNDKVAYAITIVVALIIVVGLGMYLLKPEMKPLDTSISAEQTPSAMSALDASGIPYSIDANGQILVASSDVQLANTTLAKGGFNQPPQSGYAHLLSDQTVYTSQVKENLFNTQVLEEELAKLIEGIDGVAAAKVKLALSKESQFLRDSAPAKASVVVTTENGFRLSKHQVKGIVNIVSGGIPHLPTENVVVLDQTGRLLSNSDDESATGIPQVEFKNGLESRLEQKVVSMIAPIVGMDSFRVTVEALVNFDKVENTTNEPVAPAIVVSEFSELYSDGSQGGAQGVAGALSNQPPSQAKFEATPKTAKETDDSSFVGSKKTTTNYDVGRSITHTQYSSRNVEKLNVAILIDEAFFETPEELEQALASIADMVTVSVGIDVARGDVLTINSATFFQAEAPVVPPLKFYETKWFEQVVWVLKVLLLTLIAVFAVLKPTLNTLFPKPQEDEQNSSSEITEEDLQLNDAFDFESSIDDGEVATVFREAQNEAHKIAETQESLTAKIINGFLHEYDFIGAAEAQVKGNEEGAAATSGTQTEQRELSEEEQMMLEMMEEHTQPNSEVK